MNNFCHLLLSAAVMLGLFALPLQAQTVRPGGGTQRANVSRSTSTSISASRGANGQRMYRSNTELGDAMIQIDPETRSLVIVTDEDTHNELMKVVKSLDQPKPQVLIKVVFLEVTYSKDLDLGVEASLAISTGIPTAGSTRTTTTNTTDTFTTPNGGTGTRTDNLVQTLASAALAANGVSASNVFGLASATDGSFVRIQADDWAATIHALSQKGKLEVLSRPSIMARNNQEAVIVVGSEVPFITNSRITEDGQTINTIQYDNVGVILRVTPFITSEGTVEMIVAPEISTLTDRTVPISSNASAPVIAKRSAETVVVTPNGRTVVIGGLMETQKTDVLKKVPLLGDIPFLGAAFRRTVTSNTKKELLVFLTPYIVNRPEGVTHLAEQEMAKTELVNKAFTRDEFDKYIDGPTLYPDNIVELPPPQKYSEPAVPVPVRKATAVKTSSSAATKPKSASAPRPSNPKSGR